MYLSLESRTIFMSIYNHVAPKKMFFGGSILKISIRSNNTTFEVGKRVTNIKSTKKHATVSLFKIADDIFIYD